MGAKTSRLPAIHDLLVQPLSTGWPALWLRRVDRMDAYLAVKTAETIDSWWLPHSLGVLLFWESGPELSSGSSEVARLPYNFSRIKILAETVS